VTFIANHDTGEYECLAAHSLLQCPEPACGLPADSTQGHWPFPESHLGLGYAYILTHPGIPCVFWCGACLCPPLSCGIISHLADSRWLLRPGRDHFNGTHGAGEAKVAVEVRSGAGKLDGSSFSG
jgi:hypothetical protein